MPNIKSAKKRVLVSAKKTLRNKAYTSAMKTDIKKANTAIEANSGDKGVAFKAAVKTIDQAVSKGIMKKNTAARKKSTLARKLNSTNA